MKTRNPKLAALATAALFMLGVFPASLPARDRGFDAVVQAVSTTYHAHQNLRFVTWFAGMATKVARPEGVKSLRMAIFEDQDFTPRDGEAQFEQAVAGALQENWQPLVRVRSNRDGERTFIYARQQGKDVRMFIVTLEASEAVVIEVKMNADKFAQMVDEPKHMGGAFRQKDECPRPATTEAAAEPSPLRHRDESGTP
ncbi:MAG TPA: DUF4252 domain-containing protein [Terriglobia bacterium]|nr:DUF4252 domain-containing protein [Terriglobia bacterium]